MGNWYYLFLVLFLVLFILKIIYIKKLYISLQNSEMNITKITIFNQLKEFSIILWWVWSNKFMLMSNGGCWMAHEVNLIRQIFKA